MYLGVDAEGTFLLRRGHNIYYLYKNETHYFEHVQMLTPILTATK